MGDHARLSALDGLRGLAATGIVALHVLMFVRGDAGDPPKQLLDRVMGELRLGVVLFFVLSGYLLFRPFVAAALDGRPRPSLRRYAKRRAARILPAYYLSLAGAYAVCSLTGYPKGATPGQLVAFALFAQNHSVDTVRHLNPPAWTLCVEVSFYVLLPLLVLAAGRLGARRGRQLGLCAALVAAGMAWTAAAVLLDWPETVTRSLPTHLAEFAAGMAVAAAVHGRRLSRRAGVLVGAAGLAIVAGNSWWHAYGIGDFTVRSVVADVPGAAGFALVIAALVAAPVRARALTCRPMRWLGAISYGVYLWHYVAIIGLRMTDRWPEDLGAALAITLALSLSAGAVSWLAVERPVLRWTRPPRRAREHAPPRRREPATAGATA